MRALSVMQPWASLIAHGHKKIESRSWYTAFRGELAIHAAKGFPDEARDLCYTDPFHDCLQRSGYVDNHTTVKVGMLELGAIVAVVRLVSVERTELLTNQLSLPPDSSRLTEQERAFGNYQPGRWAWHLELLYRVEPAVPCRGSLGLWDVPAECDLAVKRP